MTVGKGNCNLQPSMHQRPRDTEKYALLAGDDREKRSEEIRTADAERGPLGKRNLWSLPEESPENKTGIVRCDLIDCANNFKEIPTMPARSLCQNFLNNILAPFASLPSKITD